MRALFSRLFAYILLFKQTHLQGDFQPRYEDVRRDIAALLAQQEVEAERQGIAAQEYDDARFAVVAWADETFGGHTTWHDRQQWLNTPLQLAYYPAHHAGEEFFTRLAALEQREQRGHDQRAVREIYYMCLGLGFTGIYIFDLPRLTHLRRDQMRHLFPPPARLDTLQDLAKITPQPYDAQPPPPLRPPLSPWLLGGGLGVLLLALLVYLGLTLFSPSTQRWPLTVQPSGNGRGVITSHPEGLDCGAHCAESFTSGMPVTLHAQPAPGSVFRDWRGALACASGVVTLMAPTTCTATFVLEEQAIEQTLPKAQCALVSIDLQGAVVTLQGFVVDQGQRAAMRKAVETLQGVEHVQEKLQLIPPHFCDVLTVIEPIKHQGEEQGIRVALRLNQPGRLPEFIHGEPLHLTVTAPTLFGSHIYVDYYTADGYVGHLLPHAAEAKKVFRPNDVYTIERTANADPAGLELVTVVASQTPLWPALRDEAEPASVYLPVLRRALSPALRQTGVTATVHFLRTRSAESLSR